MTRKTKSRLRTIRSRFIFGLRVMAYLTAVVGGVFAIIDGPPSIVAIITPLGMGFLGATLLLGGLACVVGWITGSWLTEQLGAVFCAAGTGFYLWGIIAIAIAQTDGVTSGRGLQLCMIVFSFIMCLIRIFEIQKDANEEMSQVTAKIELKKAAAQQL